MDLMIGTGSVAVLQQQSLPLCTRFEVRQASQTLLNDAKVLDAVKQLKLPKDVVVQCDSWMYGADRDSNEDTHKYIQALMYYMLAHLTITLTLTNMPFHCLSRRALIFTLVKL